MTAVVVVGVGVVVGVAAGSCSGCTLDDADYGRPCDDDAGCPDGYACDDGFGFCVLPDQVGEGGEGEGEGGAPCDVDGDCDDDAFCNGAETCFFGRCIGGGDPCDGADEAGCVEGIAACVECLGDDDCADDTFCDGVERCVGGACVAGRDPCQGTFGCIENLASCLVCTIDGDCDDTKFCTGIEACETGASCVAGADPCADEGVCSEGVDACKGCEVDADCENAVFCDGAESCDVATGVCTSSGNPCTENGAGGGACDEANDACVACLTDSDCDDDLYCDGVETCAAGGAGAAAACVEGASPCAPTSSCDEVARRCTSDSR